MCPCESWRCSLDLSKKLYLQLPHRGSDYLQGPVKQKIINSIVSTTTLAWYSDSNIIQPFPGTCSRLALQLHSLDTSLHHCCPAIDNFKLPAQEKNCLRLLHLWAREHDEDIAPSRGELSHLGLKSLEPLNLYNVHHSAKKLTKNHSQFWIPRILYLRTLRFPFIVSILTIRT